MMLKNISEERKKMIVQAAKGMDERMAAASVAKDNEPEISQAEADEKYIIELFTLTEEQLSEIKELKATIAEQKALIGKLTKKLKTANIDTKSLLVAKKSQGNSRQRLGDLS